MTVLASSKVVVEEPRPRIAKVLGAPTAVTAFVIVTDWGPVREPREVNSFSQYTELYGRFSANAQDGPLSVQGFFDNGGQRAIISRVVHYTDITDVATAQGLVAVVTLVDQAGTPLSTLRLDGKFVGARGNNLKATISDATNGESKRFDLTILENDIQAEPTFVNLSMDDTDARFVETIVNDPVIGSKLVQATDLDSATAAPADRPANITATALTGGDDGLTGLADTDFIGNEAGTNGLRALDINSEIRLISNAGRATASYQEALIDYCDVTRNRECYGVLDIPAGLSADGAITHVTTTASLFQRAETGCITWPRFKIDNPNKAVFGAEDRILSTTSGHVAGVMARTHGSREGGIWENPAGIFVGRIIGAREVETDEVLDERKRDRVSPFNIIPLRKDPGTAIYVDGTENLKTDGNFATISQRQGVTFIETSLKDATQIFRHRNNDGRLRRELERTIKEFLLRQLKVGAFASQIPAEAFTIDVSDELNDASVQFAQQVIAEVRLAVVFPAKFVILRFSRDTRAIEELVGV